MKFRLCHYHFHWLQVAYPISLHSTTEPIDVQISSWYESLLFTLNVSNNAMYLQRRLLTVAAKRLASVLKTLLGLESIIELAIMTYLIVALDSKTLINPHKTKPDNLLSHCLQSQPRRSNCMRRRVFCITDQYSCNCGLVSSKKEVWTCLTLYRSIPMVYGVILTALAIYKAADFWRLSSGFKGLNLVKVLVVDQAIYFVLWVFTTLRLTEFDILAIELSRVVYSI